MTAKETERLKVLETKFDGMAEDITAIKKMVIAETSARQKERTTYVTYKVLGLVGAVGAAIFWITMSILDRS